MKMIPSMIAVAAIAIGGCRAADPAEPARGVVIAHRGASGYLPEHTLAAYALAYGQGADLIEPDVVMTRDGVLICAHDLTAEAVTDAAEKFPGRARADGKWYFADLTLAEVKTLEKRGRADRQPEGGTFSGYTVPTLEEMIQLVQALNSRTGRRVGIIPEPKSPEFHRESGLPIEPALVATLARHGYTRRDSDAIVQCFDLEALRRMRFELKCDLRLAYTLREPVDEVALAAAAEFVDALGPNRKLIEPDTGSPRPAADVLTLARRHGLEVYPWTFGDEPDAARRFLKTPGVTGIFIDYPDVGVRARR